MTRVTFNTGRLYTALGQVVTAEVRDDQVLFKDHSRGICGEIAGTPSPIESVPHWVMARYDKNEYRMSVEAINLEQSDTILNVRI